MVDQQLALSVYLRAKPAAHTKVIQCFMETGQFDSHDPALPAYPVLLA